MECARRSQRRDLFSGRGNVLIEVSPIELERAAEALGQRRYRLPAERRADLRRVRVEITDVDHLLVGGPRDATETARARGSNHQLYQIAILDRLHPTDVEHLAVRGVV